MSFLIYMIKIKIITPSDEVLTICKGNIFYYCIEKEKVRFLQSDNTLILEWDNLYMHIIIPIPTIKII